MKKENKKTSARKQWRKNATSQEQNVLRANKKIKKKKKEILPFSCRFYFFDLFFLPYEFPNQHLSFNLSALCCCATNTIPNTDNNIYLFIVCVRAYVFEF